MAQDARVAKLRRFNIVMGVLHFLQAVAVLVLSSDFALPVTTSFLRLRDGALQPEIETAVTLRVGPMVALFLFMSSIAHFAVAAPRIHEWYERNLARRINPARWIEYSLSASLMIVVIAMLVGIYDVAALILLFGVNACMILFGWMMERHNQTTERTEWIAFWFGVFAGAIPWVAVGIYLIGPAATGGAGPPGFVYGIYVSIFVFFNSFAINQVLQYRGRGRWSDYLFGERTYIVLSLVAKSLLAWQVFAGTLRPV